MENYVDHVCSFFFASGVKIGLGRLKMDRIKSWETQTIAESLSRAMGWVCDSGGCGDRKNVANSRMESGRVACERAHTC